MLTDWVLIHRLAAELEERLRGARVEDVGLLADERVGLALRRRTEREVLAIDLFSSPPTVTLEPQELAVAVEPGFVRALARALNGMRLAGVSSRRNDRLVRLTFESRSRFGVGDRLELYVELVPRFGNLVFVKADRIVAALKEFAPSENLRRSVQVGERYELPPLPVRTRQLAEHASDADDVLTAPLHVYRRAGELLQAYVVPLEGFDDAAHTREPSLLAILAELRAQQMAAAGERRAQRRRSALIKRLAGRERKLHQELAGLSEKRKATEERAALRGEGDRIFATLHELRQDDREAAKERATKVFAQYKKLGKTIPHLAARERAIASQLGILETLRWEAERAADEDLGDVEVAAAQLSGAPYVLRQAQDDRRQAQDDKRLRRSKRKRALLEARTVRGSRILVGRSPVENAELTFRHARPSDVWLHAQGIPGAHVIVARDDRSAPPEEDLELAASLAAFYSRGKSAGSVPVDYTLRKHVRKQRSAPPGLVWYTHARTILAQPKSIDSIGATPAAVDGRTRQ
jgi:predicted ribosome quality control (RQC) complex YloA/Tae2 family protein